MPELDSVVSVNITASTVTPTREGFGTALVLSYHARFTDQFRIYADLAGMAADGFVSKDPAYRQAQAMFAQAVAPNKVIVGRLPSAPSFASVLTVTSATQGLHIKCKVYDPSTSTTTQIDRTIAASSTTTAEATAVAALIDALSGVAASSSSADVTVTPATAGQRPIVFDCVNCTVKETTAAAGYDTELTALQLVNDDWYLILIDSSSDANVQAVNTWVSTQKKVFLSSTNDTREVLGTSVTGAALKAATARRTALLYTQNPVECAAAAWAGYGLPPAPGSITWALKTLVGVTPSALTATQKANLETNSLNHYMTVAGINITRNGTVCSGEYIDIIHGTDALEADIKESVFGVLVSTPAVRYTGPGLDAIANAILGALKRFEAVGLLVPGSSKVVMPELSAITTSDKSLRKLTGIKFSAVYAYAVQEARPISGTITL